MSPSTWLIVLLAAALAGLLVYALVWRVLKGGTDKKDELDPDGPHNVDRGHARSEAEAAKDTPLSEADEAEVAAFDAFAEQIRSDEYPIVDPLSALTPLDRLWTVSAAVGEDTPLFQEIAAARADSIADLFGASFPPALESAVLVPLKEPVWTEFESFTESWGRTAADVARMVARAKAEASR